ncbi:MAG: hypothetical protein ACLP59_23560 [Bryobacteraceae bacterium]
MHAAASFGIQECIEESHAGDPDGEMLGSLDFALREFIDAGFVDGDFFFERRSGGGHLAARFGEFLAQLADLFRERLVLLLEAVKTVENRFQIRRWVLSGKDGGCQEEKQDLVGQTIVFRGLPPRRETWQTTQNDRLPHGAD